MKDNNAKKHTRYSGCLLGQRIMEPRSRWDRSRSTVRERVGNDIVEYNTRGLSEDEVSRLEQVVNTSEVDVAGLKPYLNENTTFLKTCLKILTDKSFENDTFMEILDELEEEIKNDAITFVLCLFVNAEKKALLLDFLKELEKLDALKVQENHPALILACDRNSYEMVAMFVERGFRLKSGHRERHKKLKRFTSSIMSMVRVENSLTGDGAVPSGDDVVSDLFIMERCVKPAYVIACYTASISRATSFLCDCNNGTSSKVAKDVESPCEDPKKSSKMGLNEHMLKHLTSDAHLCPLERNFKVDEDCTVHPECNDPVFRCFALSKSAFKIANKFPEYRSEYEAVALAANKLSAELLDQCKDTEEAGTFLKDPFGASRYLGKADFFKYPRLKLAIEHNHKEFVGHKYCQQILSKEWHGGADWVGRPLKYKICYAIVINILAPFFLLSWMLTQFGRDVSKMKKKIGNEEEIQKPCWMKKKFFAYVKYCKDMGRRSIDVPLHRFLIFSGYYLIYLAFIFKVSSYPVESRISSKSSPTFVIDSHAVVLVYAFAMIWQDLKTMVSLRSVTVFLKKFWRAYDLFLHTLLIFMLLLRYVVSSWDFESRSTLISVSSVVTALTITVSVNRLVYWFLLHDIIGPVVINMARAVLDIFIIGITYAVVLVAFATGITFLVAERRAFLLSNNSTAHYEIAMNETRYEKIFVSLFWGFFDPGRPELFGGDDEDDDFYAGFGYAIYSVYLLVIVIVLLNMLIAILNATVQKVYDQKQLYWKFSRASVWMEFFDEELSSPPIPFGSIQIIWHIAYLILHAFLKARNQLQPTIYKTKDQIIKNRKEQADLLSDLVGRYIEKYYHRIGEKISMRSENHPKSSDVYRF